MQLFNIWAVLVATLCTLPVGFIWYNEKVFGGIWMREIGVTDADKMKENVNMFKIFSLQLLFAFMLSTSLVPSVIHQMGLGSILQGLTVTKDSKIELLLDGQAVDWMNRFRTFKHGAFHGFLMSIFVALPLIGTNSVFENRSFKYIFIHVGYWAVCLTIMGGIICAWK